jgi:hypothetical protein
MRRDAIAVIQAFAGKPVTRPADRRAVARELYRLNRRVVPVSILANGGEAVRTYMEGVVDALRSMIAGRRLGCPRDYPEELRGFYRSGQRAVRMVKPHRK